MDLVLLAGHCRPNCRSALKVAAIGSPPQQEEGWLHEQEMSRSLISSCRRGGVVQKFRDHTTPSAPQRRLRYFSCCRGHPSCCSGGEPLVAAARRRCPASRTLHDKHKRNDGYEDDTKEPGDIDKRNHCRLTMDHSINSGISLLSRHG